MFLFYFGKHCLYLGDVMISFGALFLTSASDDWAELLCERFALICSHFSLSPHELIVLVLYWKQNLLLSPLFPLRPRFQHAPRQCEGMWGGIWETRGQPHDVSHADSDRQEPTLVCVQRSHRYRVPGQRSRLVNTSCLCFWTLINL